MFVRPGEHGVVVGARVIRSPARAGLGLALEVRVGGAHDGLPEIIEAVRRVVRDLLRQVRAGVASLVVIHDIGQAVQLVKHGHHVGGAVGHPVYRHDVGVAERVVGGVVGDLDVASCF